MKETLEAVYENGVFRPLTRPHSVAEHVRVTLTVTSNSPRVSSVADLARRVRTRRSDGSIGDARNDKPKKDISRIIRDDPELITRALQEGVRKAMLRHKKAGQLVVIERNGKIEWVRPEDLGF